MKRLCTICARGGSKGVKNKNVRLLAGRPLLAHSILQARQAGCFEAVAVSSDSPLILDLAGQWGADHLIRRPDELATDTAPKIPAIRHCVEQVEATASARFDTVVDLDATSPLRSPKDILAVVRLLEERGVSNVITGSPARRSPYFNLVEIDGRGVAVLSKSLSKAVTRRQDAPRCFDMNASIYAWRRDALDLGQSVFLADTALYEMGEDQAYDIDSELDFRIVELIMSGRETGKSETGEGE